ncbi:hypothetical protein KI387_000109, partial [Taxus chinensis]
MASFHGEFCLGLVIICSLCVTCGSTVDNSFHLEQVVLEESSIANGFSGILGEIEKQNVCHIKNSSCSFQDIQQLLSCEEDLKGIGSLNTTCQLNTSLQLHNDVLIIGEGNLEILPHVSVSCHLAGCVIGINISGDLILGENSSLGAGTLILDAKNLSLQKNSSLNTTALGGVPPPQTSGTPLGVDGAGGGHGGRGACCIKDEGKDQEDTWGGDVYAWSSLTNPWSYGSKGGTTTREKELGGGGGGRVKIVVSGILDVNGSISADGGDGGHEGGGGSGGSIILLVPKLKGTGAVSASGGKGWAGGGGGRVSIKSYSRQASLNIFVH